MSAKYAGFEPMSQFEIDAFCNRLSQPKKRTKNQINIHAVAPSMNKSYQNGNKSSQTSNIFLVSKRISSNSIQSLVDRLSNPSSARSRTDVLKEGKMHERSVVSSYVWSGKIRQYPKCSLIQPQNLPIDNRRNVKLINLS